MDRGTRLFDRCLVQLVRRDDAAGSVRFWLAFGDAPVSVTE